MGDYANLFWGILFGSIGFGYFLYGKKQKSVIPFVSGIGLMGLPYVVDNNAIMIGLAVVLMLLPKFIAI
ncbi:hypothetical protein [Gynuella sunshinyii]|uniref:Amino acid transport protein n=1 Tax=Gynuella sunshinyii YC6258 TaxID=1445510 RepID=A0A0C5VN90_9GAMM|nr:hypothetical protein [Gynuella sunshinyii]AJQ94823.1 hypothetical Protein YC6258_02785 [Gynuella sunshinyii YC6258]